MCEFCHQHGEGKKWYLDAKNYSQDLLSDARRRSFIRGFFTDSDHLSDDVQRLGQLDGAPGFIRRMISGRITSRMKKEHFGQVLPLEDIETIFGFVNSIARIACICRNATLGREERYCYGLSINPNSGAFGDIFADIDTGYAVGPHLPDSELLSPDEALQAFADHEKEGLCHTVWTFVTPFIGGICNCDQSDCLAMKATVGHDVKVFFRGETIAEVNPDLCTGCRSCMRLCQFGALAFSAADEKISVRPKACYGCGICRSACAKDAITLRPRSEVPIAAALW